MSPDPAKEVSERALSRAPRILSILIRLPMNGDLADAADVLEYSRAQRWDYAREWDQVLVLVRSINGIINRSSSARTRSRSSASQSSS